MPLLSAFHDDINVNVVCFTRDKEDLFDQKWIFIVFSFHLLFENETFGKFFFPLLPFALLGLSL